MKNFLDDNFLLNNKTAETLYHQYAKDMPIIDYHCHLPPNHIANNTQFENLTQIWLYGDHYKWRAMRTNGVDEHFITGTASDKDKFLQWAKTVPYTLRNPLYHWTHLELQRYFDVHTVLNEQTANKIYDECSEKLRSPEYSVKNLLRKMNVHTVCTTDDPIDSLEYHQQLKNDGFEIPILPAYRPDAAMNPDNPVNFNKYVDAVATASAITINSYDDYLAALKNRHDYFTANGCKVSDHGLEEMYVTPADEATVAQIFLKVRNGATLTLTENHQLRAALLQQFAEWDHEKGWIQQYHLGAIRNNNTRMATKLGADTGWDSIGDFSHAKATATFLNKLDTNNKLTKTILYNLNPADNELMATMIGNFNDGSAAGKIQWGSAWWFLDQKDGMTKQINALSNMGLLSKFVGMLTDSRSFLSYPRHEYFRRLLCNMFGEEIENGELPNDIEWTGSIIKDICFNNAQTYFNF
ncbi:glucuronate isomerase [Ferruginibacter yonginensis]|uniref:Uronate isomerase n=1 Tax=Ferruginibacter yonginensis TaxID=1310416 RepID=A0ABV8QML1_9BACT